MTSNSADYSTVSTTITSPMAHLPIKDPARIAADRGVLAAFWDAEAAMGYPVAAQAQANQLKLMAISGVVSTTGHKLTKVGEQRAKAAARAAQAAAAAPPQKPAAAPQGKTRAA
jgi:hypothetical protein